MARFSRSVILLKTGRGMTCNRSELCGPGIPGGALSKSVPMLNASRNWSRVGPGRPAAFGVRLRGYDFRAEQQKPAAQVTRRDR